MPIHENEKLAPLAIKTIFIGYSYTQKGYKLSITKHIHISRRVIFNEDIFSCASDLFCSNQLPFTVHVTTFCDDTHDTPLDTFMLPGSSSELLTQPVSPPTSYHSKSRALLEFFIPPSNVVHECYHS